MLPLKGTSQILTQNRIGFAVYTQVEESDIQNSRFGNDSGDFELIWNIN